MTRVNPPPHNPIPDAFSSNDELREYFLALQRNIFQLWERTGGGDDALEDVGAKVAVQMAAQQKSLQDQVGSGDILSWDETGFTFDTDKIYFDREAV
jgi:hypothetical protein